MLPFGEAGRYFDRYGSLDAVADTSGMLRPGPVGELTDKPAGADGAAAWSGAREARSAAGAGEDVAAGAGAGAGAGAAAGAGAGDARAVVTAGGAGAEAGETEAAARLTEVVSGTVSTRPGCRCALVRRWLSSASVSIGTP